MVRGWLRSRYGERTGTVLLVLEAMVLGFVAVAVASHFGAVLVAVAVTVTAGRLVFLLVVRPRLAARTAAATPPAG